MWQEHSVGRRIAEPSKLEQLLVRGVVEHASGDEVLPRLVLDGLPLYEPAAILLRNHLLQNADQVAFPIRLELLDFRSLRPPPLCLLFFLRWYSYWLGRLGGCLQQQEIIVFGGRRQSLS